MTVNCTPTSYGSVSRAFHWITALLILTAFPLGIVANGLPFDTGEELARKALMFSMHKTVGVLAFFVGVARILWALTQTHVVALHPDRKLQTWAASVAHWLLYASLVLVPLSGWIHHAATEGFAPIWWPFGQSLPLVPKNETVSHFFQELHFVFTKVLALTILAHIAGALKHHLLDRDDTLRRMTRGIGGGDPVHADGGRGPMFAAIGIWAAAFAGGTALSMTAGGYDTGPAPQLEAVASDWTVQEGDITFSVLQLGSAVEGRFEDWTAIIGFDPDVTDGTAGNVEVTISVPSVNVGSVTGEALKPDFFDATGFPTAIFTGDILIEAGSYRAAGVLSLKGTDLPIEFPFDMTVDGDTASMAGALTLQRLDFGIGQTYPDESSVGFAVDVSLSVTATRGTPDQQAELSE
ncbi:MAG: cytochrome b/b6 domain-containing protein [Pseudomonadota bacterium]